MSTHTTKPSNSIVTINSVELRPIEVDNQRVVTLAMIDKVHGRPDGTARRSFNTNRARFADGKHCFVRNSSEAAALGITAPNGITLLTERGYLMLVKSFTDDLAWEVQDMLVASYFDKKELIMDVTRRPTPYITTAVAREVRLTGSWLERLAKASGITGNQALIAASQGTERMTGVNPLALMGITHMPAPQNENLLCPTDIGKRVGGMSAKAINLLLTGLGLQTVDHDHRGKVQYEPTSAGVEAGGIMQDTGKKHGNGTPVRQLRWASSIVHVVDEALQREHAA